MNNAFKGAQAYQGTNDFTRASEASPHQLIAMLYEGALARLQTAKGAMERQDIPTKGTMISKAIGIIEGLRVHLNAEKGGEIANHLNDLYEYMETQLLQANLTNNSSLIEEVEKILEDLRSGWAGIKEQAGAIQAESSKQ